MSGPLEAWQDMVTPSRPTAGPTADILNTLTFAGVPLKVRSDDTMGPDKFYRYMGTLQAVFDAAGSPRPGRGGGSPRGRGRRGRVHRLRSLRVGLPRRAVSQGDGFPVAYLVDPLL